MNCNSQNAIYKNCKSQTACIELINCNRSILPSCYKFLLFFQQLWSPETAVFPHSPVRLPLIAHSQSNLQFQFTKAIAIQLYVRQITLFCQFKLVNIGLQLILIYLLEKKFILLQTHRTTEQSRHTYQAHTYTSNVIITVFAHDSKLQHNHTNNTIKCEYEQSTRKHHCLTWLVPQHNVYT